MVALNSDETPIISVFDRRDSIDFAAELDAAISTPIQRKFVTSNQNSTPNLISKVDNNTSTHSLLSTKQIKETNFNGSKLNDNNITLTPLTTSNHYPSYLKTSIFNESEMDRSMASITTLPFQSQQTESVSNLHRQSPIILSYPNKLEKTNWNKPIMSNSSFVTNENRFKSLTKTMV